jgi:hypothetical protein
MGAKSPGPNSHIREGQEDKELSAGGTREAGEAGGMSWKPAGAFVMRTHNHPCSRSEEQKLQVTEAKGVQLVSGGDGIRTQFL